jgi:hypothetical protein
VKTIASILLLYFSFLATQPLLPLVQKQFATKEKCEMPCCQKHKPANHKAPVNNCCRDLCNPFGQYSCCTGFVVEKETTSPFIREHKNALVIPTVFNISQRNCSDCWRPPEGIVS